MAALNYKVLGLKCGLEIHQELQTKRKLFCYCPPELRTGEPDFYIKRNFRPVLGEMGKFDAAMLVEYEKRLNVIYEVHDDVCCSYEMDETPPFKICKEALRTGLIMGMLLNLNLYNELYVCRKNYLDGSVPCGFQRTLLIGSDGYLDVADKKIGITTIAIEEDAARKIDEDGKTVTYRLDRLGIPLIEIVTEPDMTTPDECMSIAYRLGQLLRSTALMKRGLGTIRQDVNVSIEGGARVEIKGVQKLEWIPPLIETEVRRQLSLLKIRNELVVRKITKEDLSQEFVDATNIFKKTSLQFMKNAIKAGQTVLAVKIPRIEGILGTEVIPGKNGEPGIRFGKEIAQKVSAITGLKGIIHSDEDMDGYSFKKTEIAALKKLLEIEEPVKKKPETKEEAEVTEKEETEEPKADGFIIVVADEQKAKIALAIALNRIMMAIEGVPNETRKALENYNTEFIRELHGGARLYPDTDSTPIRLNKDTFKEIKKQLPEYPWNVADRLRANYEMDEALIDNLIYQGFAPFFEEIISGFNINPTLVATTFLETLKSIKRDGLDSENITYSHLRELFELVHKQEIAKEAIEDVLKVIAETPTLSIKEAKDQLEIEAVSLEEVDTVITEILTKNKDLLEEGSERAHKKLMGQVMKILRGKVDGKIISDKLMDAIESYSPEEGKEETEQVASARQINRLIKELLAEDENILKEKGEDAFDILFIKLKKRVKGRYDEEKLAERLRNAIKDYLK